VHKTTTQTLNVSFSENFFILATMKTATSVIIMAMLWQLSAASRKKQVIEKGIMDTDTVNQTELACACNERWGTLRPHVALPWNRALKPNGYCNEFNSGAETDLHLPLASANKDLVQCDCNPEGKWLTLGLTTNRADNYDEQAKLVVDSMETNAKLATLKKSFEANLKRMEEEFKKKWEQDVKALETEYSVKFQMPTWKAPAAMPSALTVEKFVLRDRDPKNAKAAWSCCCKSKTGGKCVANTMMGIGGIGGYHHEAPVSACP